MPKKDEVKGPRATAVLESTAHGMRLIPITIKIDDQFYDATIYKAQPVPMALDSGVIYEVFKSGEPVGDFTIHEAEQNEATGAWRGVGSFVTKAQEDRAIAQRAKEKAAEAAQNAADEKEDLGSRPVLKRAKPKEGEPSDTSQTGSSTQTTSSSGSSGGSSDDSDRPVLKKPATSDNAPTPAPTQPPAQSQPATTATVQAPATSSTCASAKSSNDSDAPVLRRAPAKETVAGPYKPTDVAVGKSTQQTAAAANKETGKISAPPPGPRTMQVAISDATPIQPHPYRWEWKDAEEQAKLKADAEKLALAELAKFAARTSGVKPGNLVDVSFDAFDLNYTNSAVVVLSARALPAPAAVSRASAKTHAAASTPAPDGLEFYVTVVGRVDIYGAMQKELAVATDNHHLDAYPKMKLIDAVDVDGNGGADLLFHSTSDVSSSFVIYRDKGWSLEQVISVQEPKS